VILAANRLSDAIRDDGMSDYDIERLMQRKMAKE
jgi:hypothetical protein